jgi:XTP/dITP diphosphohydrolase
MMQLVFATNNKHKLEEISAMLDSRFSLQSLEEVGITEDIPEEEDTLEGNASAKARYVHRNTGANCFADDTGLEIESLDGRPGVKSARYAGPECISANNIKKVLAELDGVDNRKARFRTIISLILEGKEYQFEGIVNGKIINEERGSKGFGYDPVFIPDGYEETFAEMSLSLKNQISHRANALKKLVSFLLQLQSSS